MKVTKKVVFIGARFNVLEQLLKTEDQNSLTIFALENSFLANTLNEKQIAYRAFQLGAKKKLLETLFHLPFDILVSNGCPFILPVSKFKRHQKLINVHPTYLPYLQGKTPLNGVFYDNYDFYGATMHYMDEGIDTGDIIYQKKEMLTPDIDLGLLYYLSMKLEGTVFAEGWEKLKSANFEYSGQKQLEKGSYFNREPQMQQLDFTKDSDEHLLRCIKSFGIGSQGCRAQLNRGAFVIYAAEPIVHKPLLNQFKAEKAGNILLEYDGKLLVKTPEGIIKLTNYSSITSKNE